MAIKKAGKSKARPESKILKRIMKINLIIRGGLGNQIFQYALATSLRNQGHEVRLDTSMYDMVKMHNGYELDRVFGINDPIITKGGLHLLKLRLLHKFRPSSLYLTDTGTYNPDLLTSPKKYINGYWQDERYFKDVEPSLRQALTFAGIDPQNQSIAEEMKKVESVSFHLRRGDYSAYGMTLLGEDYYKKSVSTILERTSDPVFYIFSDDKEAAEAMAKNVGIRYRLMGHNRGDSSYKDMYLMSNCKHNIIANSSFSWWGAWLNANKSKVVTAPQVWDSKHPEYHPQLKDWILL